MFLAPWNQLYNLRARRSFLERDYRDRVLDPGRNAMLLTDSGIDQLAHWREKIANYVGSFVHGRSVDALESYQETIGFCEYDGAEVVFETPEPALLRFRSHLQSDRLAPSLSGREQRARVLALRGLSQARVGEYERAQMTFASAARLDPGLDLALLPSFWDLPRRAHQAAIAALHEADRGRDAAALTATMRTRFRPRALHGITLASERSGKQNE